MNFIKDSLLLVIGFGLKILFVLLTDRVLAINLGPENYGIYKYSITIVTILSSISTFGFASSVVKTVSLYKDNKQYLNKVFKSSFAIQMGISFFLLVIFLIPSVSGIVEIHNKGVFNIILTSIVAITFNQIFIGIYSAFKKTNYKVIINDISHSALLYVFLLILFSYQIDLFLVCLIYVVLVFLILIINLIFIIKIIKPYLNFRTIFIKNRISIRDFYKYSFPIFITVILISFSASIDKIVLSYLVTEKDLGIYFSAFMLSSVLNFILASLLFIYLPIASYYFTNNKFKQGGIISTYISKWLMIIVFIPFWLLFYYSSTLINLFYDNEFLEGKIALSILAVSGFINVSAGFTGQNLLALGDSLNQMKIRIIGLFMGLLLAILLGNLYHINGIAISVLITLVITNLLQILVAYYKHKVRLIQKVNGFGFLYIIVFILLLHFFHTFVQVKVFPLDYLLDIALYFIFILSLKIFSKKDFRIIKIINKIK